MTYPTLIAIRLVRAYKLFLSPWLPPVCRFTPTCSSYAIEAFERYGFVRGIFRSALRILRCQPFHVGGFDPLP